MKHIPANIISATAFIAVTIPVLPVQAADALTVRWNEVCEVANGRQLELTTNDNKTVEGYCVAIDVSGIQIEAKDGGVVRVARKTLSRLQMRRSKGHQLRSLGKGIRQGLSTGFDALLSPWASAGIVMLPVTLAWGAVAVPFCLLGDLRYKLEGKREINPI